MVTSVKPRHQRLKNDAKNIEIPASYHDLMRSTVSSRAATEGDTPPEGITYAVA